MKNRIVLLPPGGISQSCGWSTDQKLFDYLNKRFGPFVLDVCATAQDTKCARFFSPEIDGLSQEWNTGPIWMNPPYGRAGKITLWMEKARTCGQCVVCLVPVRSDTAWWHDIAMAGDVYLIRGRLRFGGLKQPAPFPSAVVVFEAQ